MQEVAKAHYYLGDFETSLKYYRKFVEIKNTYKLNIYRAENGKIGVVCDKMGLQSEATKFFNAYFNYAENDKSIYSNFSLFMYYAYKGETKKAMEHLVLFSEKENFHYWTVLFTPIDPLIANVQQLPEYKKVFGKIEADFKKYHKRVEKSLKEKGLI
jgi:tetratricopeptide (TPR) repeat protein